jgi:hypothetical protein
MSQKLSEMSSCFQWGTVKNTDKDQFFEGADEMVFPGIKYQKRVRPTGMFNAIAACKDASTSDDNYKEW